MNHALEPPARPRDSSGARRLLLTAGIFLALMSYALGLTVFGPVVAPLAADLLVSEAAAGALAAWMSVGFLAATLACGPWAERRGLGPPALVGALLLSAGFLTLSAAPGYAAAAAGMVLYGAGGGLCEVTANAGMADLYPERRVSALNALHVFFGIAALLGPRLAGHLVAAQGGWRTVYLVAGAFALAPLPFYLFLRFPAPPALPAAGAQDRTGQPAAPLWRSPTLWVLVAAVLFYVGAEISINNWGVLFLQRARGWEVVAAAGAVSNFWLAMTAGRIAVSVLAHRAAPERVLLLLCLGATLCVGVFVFGARAPLAATLSVVAVGCCFSGIFATLYALGVGRFPHRSALITSALTAAAGTGILVLAPAVGFVAQWVGIGRAMALVPGYVALLLACVFWLARGSVYRNRSRS